MKTALSCCVVVACIALSAHGDDLAIPTLEWLADNCINAGIYVATNVSTEAELPSYHVAFLALQSPIIGNPTAHITRKYSKHLISKRGEPNLSPGDRFLLCEAGFLTQYINLSNPAFKGPREVAISCDLNVLRDGDVVLGTFTNRAQVRTSHDDISDRPWGTITNALYELGYNYERYTKATRLAIVLGATGQGGLIYLLVPPQLRQHVIATGDEPLALIEDQTWGKWVTDRAKTLYRTPELKPQPEARAYPSPATRLLQGKSRATGSGSAQP